MKILCTGGSGFIGSHLVEALMAAGHLVDVLDVRKPLKANQWINRDIRQSLYDVIKGYDAVYHLAAIANARICGQMPNKAYEVNVLGTFNVADACRENKIPHLLYASSTWISGAQVPTGDLVDEENPLIISEINTIYAATKVASEALLFSFHNECDGPPFTIMRFGIPYGSRMWEGLAVRGFLLQAEKYKTLSVMGDGLQGRNFLFVKDLAEAQVSLLDEKAKGRTYHLGNPEFVTINRLAEEIQKHFDAEIIHIPNPRVEPKVKEVSCEAIYKDFGWKPKTSFSEGIKECVNWWRNLDPALKEETPYFTV